MPRATDDVETGAVDAGANVDGAALSCAAAQEGPGAQRAESRRRKPLLLARAGPERKRPIHTQLEPTVRMVLPMAFWPAPRARFG